MRQSILVNRLSLLRLTTLSIRTNWRSKPPSQSCSENAGQARGAQCSMVLLEQTAVTTGPRAPRRVASDHPIHLAPNGFFLPLLSEPQRGSPLSRLLATVMNFSFLPRWISSTPSCRSPGFRRPCRPAFQIPQVNRPHRARRQPELFGHAPRRRASQDSPTASSEPLC